MRAAVSGRILGAMVPVVLLLSACGSGPEAQAEPTPIPISPACREAFEAAQERLEEDAQLGEAAPTAPVSPIPEEVRGSLADLYDTIPACESTTEWMEAFRAHPTTLTSGYTPSTALRRLCEATDREDVSSSDLCGSVVRGDTQPEEPEPSETSSG